MFSSAGNLNRHKKVKHGLNETTDVMEEDAVNFLSSLSERARDEPGGGDEEGDLSAGEGDEEGDERGARKVGRKSVPRKIAQGEELAVGYPPGPPPPSVTPAHHPSVSLVHSSQAELSHPPHDMSHHPSQPPHHSSTKSFVIQNPNDDTDEDTEEDISVEAPGHQDIHHKDVVNGLHESQGIVEGVSQAQGVQQMMTFQPLNNVPADQLEEGEISLNSRKRLYEEEMMLGNMGDKRPRRQSQRRSPKVHSGNMQQSDSDEYDAENLDNADDDWVPGLKGRHRGGGSSRGEQLVDRRHQRTMQQQ